MSPVRDFWAARRAGRWTASRWRCPSTPRGKWSWTARRWWGPGSASRLGSEADGRQRVCCEKTAMEASGSWRHVRRVAPPWRQRQRKP
jgi:hypothetical protein